MLNPASVNNILLREVAFTSWNSATSKNNYMRNFKIFPSASFHYAYSYALRPIHTHSSTKYWFIYMFGSLLPSNFGDANWYLYWTIICRNHSKKLISIYCRTSLHHVSRQQSHLLCTSISLFHTRDLQNINW